MTLSACQQCTQWLKKDFQDNSMFGHKVYWDIYTCICRYYWKYNGPILHWWLTRICLCLRLLLLILFCVWSLQRQPRRPPSVWISTMTWRARTRRNPNLTSVYSQHMQTMPTGGWLPSSSSGKTFWHQSSWNIEAARCGFRVVWTL